jgi:hypothetical protein
MTSFDFLDSDIQRLFQKTFKLGEMKTLSQYFDEVLDNQKFLLPDKTLDKVSFLTLNQYYL